MRTELLISISFVLVVGKTLSFISLQLLEMYKLKLKRFIAVALTHYSGSV